MDNKLVSIIIPTYNCGAYIEGLIDSIMEQTYTKYEVIVVDDGSTDNTEEIVGQYNGITYIPLSKNMGAQQARKVGREAMKGSYAVFLDADSLLTQNYLTKLLTALDGNKKAGFAYCDRIIGLEQNENTHWIKKKSGRFSKDRLFKGNYISFCSMVRADAIQDFDDNVDRLQDWDFWLSIIKVGWGAVYVSGYLFIMFMRPGGISSHMERWDSSISYIKNKHHLS